MTYSRVWNKGVLCESARSSQNRLTALGTVGRFLPRWASSPAWQRRLDVIKVYTLPSVWGCVKWALLLPKACTVIVYLHHSWWNLTKEEGLQRRRPELQMVSFTCPGSVFQMFFFFVSLFICPSVLAEGWWISHIPNEKILLVSRLIRTLWGKKRSLKEIWSLL